MSPRLVVFIGIAQRPGEMLAGVLSRDGMRCLWLAGVDEALAAARLAVYDAVVLDAAAVQGAAAGRLAQMRSTWRCPILLVAQQADEIDEIVALELGADAYLAHPLAPRRLRAHLAALMRLQRSGRAPEPAAATTTTNPQARFDGWSLDRASGVLVGNGQRVELSRVQARLLACLMDAAGRPVARAELIAALPHGPVLAARSVDVYLSRLRQRLLAEGARRLDVQLVRGYGYALCRASPVAAGVAAGVEIERQAA